MFNPPDKPLRPFEADYPNGAPVNAEGRLAVDIEGRPLTAPHVAGRRVLGGADEAIPSTEFNALAKETTGRDLEAVPPRRLGTDLSRIGYNKITGRPEYIIYRDDLPLDKVPMAVAHELGHAVSQIAGQIPTKNLTGQLLKIYNTLGNPARAPGGLEAASWGKPWTPEAASYSKAQSPRELWAEAIRAYITNPNYLKSIAPEVAKHIRLYVNAHPELSKIIQFNAIGGAGYLGATKKDLPIPQAQVPYL
jgi:hypothetical protein